MGMQIREKVFLEFPGGMWDAAPRVRTEVLRVIVTRQGTMLQRNDGWLTWTRMLRPGIDRLIYEPGRPSC
jgi:hypothetical protein